MKSGWGKRWGFSWGARWGAISVLIELVETKLGHFGEDSKRDKRAKQAVHELEDQTIIEIVLMLMLKSVI